MKTNYLLKNIFVSVIVACGLLFSQANAQTINGIAYKIIDGNVVEVAPLPKNGDQDVRYSQASIVIPASVEIGGTTYPVKKIGASSMRDNPNLTSVTIPDGLEVIGNSAFASCKALTSINIPATVNSIEDWAFYECSSLASITIPNGIKSIGEHQFQLSGLTSITLPASVTSLKTCAFQDASKLASINLENITAIGAWSLYGTAIVSANISNVNTILSAAFGKCPNLETVKLNNVITAGDWAFQDCNKLKNVDLGVLESINTGVFSGCSALTSLIIPNSVVYIGDWALEKIGLNEVFISWETPNETVFIEKDAFGKDEGKAHFTWKVPSELANVYGSTWNGFPVSSTTGIKSIQNSNAKVYYSDGILNLTGLSGYSISIFSVTGQKHSSFRVIEENEQFFISLPHGVYLLNATNATDKIALKFIAK